MKHGLALSTGLPLIADLLLATPSRAETALFSVEGYRFSHYRSPTPTHTEHARTLGYHNLYWYRDGIDSGQQAGLPVARAQPLVLP